MTWVIDLISLRVSQTRIIRQTIFVLPRNTYRYGAISLRTSSAWKTVWPSDRLTAAWRGEREPAEGEPTRVGVGNWGGALVRFLSLPLLLSLSLLLLSSFFAFFLRLFTGYITICIILRQHEARVYRDIFKQIWKKKLSLEDFFVT